MTDTSSSQSLRVFLCHSSADKPAVRELYQRLCADGIDAWLDEENLLPGQDWQREIPRAVRQSDAVIVCLSKSSINKAGYVQKEIKFALDVADEQPEDTIFLIPLKLEECDVPERLNRWQWVNLASATGYERLLKALRFRATSLGTKAASTPVTSSSQSPAATPSSAISNVSGGVNLEGQQVNVGKDVVGRDKVIQANTYIEHATFVQGTPLTQESQVVRPHNEAPKSNVQTWGGVDFVRIPAGKFLMGSKDDNQLARYNEKPQHSVEIPYDYWLARYPVTNEQFAKFVEKNWKKKAYHPVVDVSWNAAMEYCKWLTDLVKAELPAQNLIVCLPTEAEWEKAARGEYGNEWPWGNEFDQNKCNSREGGQGSTTPVGANSPQDDSPHGIADMAGNVWEWCHSLYKSYPYKMDDGREDELKSEVRVLRGGAANYDQHYARCAFRYFSLPGNTNDSIGFRVVVSPGLG